MKVNVELLTFVKDNSKFQIQNNDEKKIEIVELDINPLSYAILGKDIPNFHIIYVYGQEKLL